MAPTIGTGGVPAFVTIPHNSRYSGSPLASYFADEDSDSVDSSGRNSNKRKRSSGSSKAVGSKRVLFDASTTTPRPMTGITSIDGTVEFVIKIPKLNVSFTTTLTAISRDVVLEGLLPSSLVAEKRVSVAEMNKFIMAKTWKNWRLHRIKLSSIVGMSSRGSYKKFFNEYESLERVALAKISDSAWLFLVTPRFQEKCECLRGLHLSKSKTHAILLRKKE